MTRRAEALASAVKAIDAARLPVVLRVGDPMDPEPERGSEYTGIGCLTAGILATARALGWQPPPVEPVAETLRAWAERFADAAWSMNPHPGAHPSEVPARRDAAITVALAPVEPVAASERDRALVRAGDASAADGQVTPMSNLAADAIIASVNATHPSADAVSAARALGPAPQAGSVVASAPEWKRQDATHFGADPLPPCPCGGSVHMGCKPQPYYLIERNDRGRTEWLQERDSGVLGERIAWVTDAHVAKRFDWSIAASRFMSTIARWPEMEGVPTTKTEHLDIPPSTTVEPSLPRVVAEIVAELRERAEVAKGRARGALGGVRHDYAVQSVALREAADAIAAKYGVKAGG